MAGLLYPLAFAPYNQAWLVIVSLAVLWWLVRDASPKQNFQLGFIFGAGQFGLGVSWVYVSMATFGGTNAVVSSLMTGVFIAVLALFPALTCWLTARLSRKHHNGLSPYLFIVSWLLFDWIRGWLLSGFPWLYAGYAAIDNPLANLAAYGGVQLVTLAVVCTALLPDNRLVAQKRFWPITGLTIGLWLAAWLLPTTPGVKPVGHPQPVALVQANIHVTVKWDPEHQKKTREIYHQLTQTIANKQSLVLWSESSLTEFYRSRKAWLEEQAAPFAAAGGSLIAGLPRFEMSVLGHPRFYNSLIVVSGGKGIYNKQKLVPFGEYVPFGNIIRGLVPFFNLPMSSFTAGGPHQANLQIQNGVNIAPFVCYDILYPRLVARQARGSNVLVEVSDDAWFGDSAGPWQHLQMARMRAIETGRYLLRDTNTGITAIVNAQGDVIASLPQFQRDILTGMYQPMQGQTPYMSWGRWILPLLCVLLLLISRLIGRDKSSTD